MQPSDEPEDPSRLTPPAVTPRALQTEAVDELDGEDVRFEVSFDPLLTPALLEAGTPIVRWLKLENRSRFAFEDLVVRVGLGDELVPSWESYLRRLPGGATFTADDVHLDLSAQVALAQRDGAPLVLWSELHHRGALLVREEWPLEILAADEWAGLRSVPETLAAFVQPTSGVVDALIARAGAALHPNAPRGYAAPEHVWERMGALWDAAAASGLAAAACDTPLASQGGALRSPDALFGEGGGNVLELALFFAAGLERCGFHPLLLVGDRSVLVGAWLTDEVSPTATMDQVARFQRRVDRNETVFFDAALLAGEAVGAEEAAVRGRERLGEPEELLFGLDVEAARRAGVLPLEAHDESGATGPSSWSTVDTSSPERRIETWKRRLLDLTLRNRFLNFVPHRKTIILKCPDLPALHAELAHGEAFEVLHKSRQMSSSVSWERLAENAKDDSDYLNGELGKKRLHAMLDKQELERRLLELYRSSRLSVEETGANVLYLACGFLEWFDRTTPDRKLRAPILLLPLTIERLSMKKGFRIQLADEESRVNVTLLEKLEAEHGLELSELRDLQDEDQGLDVAALLERWRTALDGQAGWEIQPDACIGLFSFTKFLMWLDLERHADLLREHRVLKYLVERPEDPFEDTPFPDAGAFDRRAPASLFLPMDADSSQIAAVIAAEEGRSFVLEGPPGTGKSQTITNLIAHCLGTGKRVLFVAEKKAALSVVKDRLTSVGLGPFCLELHSNKSNKQEVLDQLRATLEVAAGEPPSEWDESARRLDKLRLELNGYVSAVHGQRALGKSLYQVVEALLDLRGVPAIQLSFERPEEVTAEEFSDLVDQLDRLAAAAEAAGDPSQHPLRGVERLDWDRALPQKLTAALAAVRQSLTDLEAAHLRTGRLLGHIEEATGQVPDPTRDGLQALAAVASHLAHTPGPDGRWLAWGRFEVYPRMQAWIDAARALEARRRELSGSWSPDFLGIEVEAWRERVERVERSLAPVRGMKVRALRKELAPFLLAERTVELEEFLAGLRAVEELRASEAHFDGSQAELMELFQERYRGPETDWDTLERELAYCVELRRLLGEVGGESPSVRRQLAHRWTAIATNEGGLLDNENLPLDLTAYSIALGAFRDRWNEYVHLARLDEGAVIRPDEAGFLARVGEHLASWEEQHPDLRDWLHWQKVRNEVAGTMLGPVVEACERGAFPAGQAVDVFRRCFFEQWLNRLLETDGALHDFHGSEHTRKVQRFRELDLEWIELTQGLLRAKLGASVAHAMREGACAGEMGLLERELRKKRKLMPIRKLFGELPNLLPRLKPCALMSPLAAAQYLDAGLQSFDLVVFDEASQIPIWDAVGAMARGKQVVVVGDSRQLPPTNFFATIEDEDDPSDEDFEELDSLLEECVASRLPSLQLRWHYRSRHESLIAFSNQHYYANRLLTFPSPMAESDDLGVRFHFVENAVHDRGDTATNRAEAEAMVAEAVRILRRTRREDDPLPSLGMVTFSLPQQRLVEELLEEARQRHPEIEVCFGDEAEDPVFVKNLESVQGDERDSILLGVGFGPDAEGRFSMNFGPLCRDGGERRLNVAVTRARRRLVVFSSLRASDIDLARTRAIGAKHLKAFLDFAERGVRTSAALLLDERSAHGSRLEDDVHERLIARGWQVERQIGCSDYRIDLALRHPEDPTRFVLGIECDGDNYRRAATARDRDRLRQHVLKGLGWALHRVWSPDWWLQPEREVERIEQAVEVALKAEAGVPRVRVRRAED